MPDEPPEPEPGRTPVMILADLSNVWATFLSAMLTLSEHGLQVFPSTIHCFLNRLPALYLELGVALGPGYDFDAWVKDLEEKGTAEAKELAEKVTEVFDALKGAY